MITVNVPFSITSQQLADWFTTAFEGGSNYWISKVRRGHDRFSEPNWYSDPVFYEVDPNFSLMNISYSETDDGSETETVTITLAKIASGLIDAPVEALQNLVTDHVDAEEADSLLQMVCFGEIRFG